MNIILRHGFRIIYLLLFPFFIALYFWPGCFGESLCRDSINPSKSILGSNLVLM